MQRILTGIICLLITAVFFYCATFNPFILKVYGLILLLAAAYEYINVVEKRTIIPEKLKIGFFIAIILAPAAVFLGAGLNAALVASLATILGLLLFVSRESLPYFNHWLVRFAPGIILISIGGAALISLSSNIYSLVLVVLITTINDVTAYEIGSIFQGPKFAPAISPKKTIIGSATGIAGGVISGSIFILSMYGYLSFYQVLSLLLAVVLAQFGDLLKSVVKREHEVKDFSDILPGHGGILDRLDGILLAAIALSALGVCS